MGCVGRGYKHVDTEIPPRSEFMNASISAATPPDPPRDVVLLVRPQCDCSDRARAILDAAQIAYREVTPGPHDLPAGLRAEELPALVVDGQIRFRGQISPVWLRRLFPAAAAPRDAATGTPNEPAT